MPSCQWDVSNEAFNFIGRGDIAGIPFSLAVMITLYVGFSFILRFTPFGRNLYAIGGSAEASRLAGISVTPHLLTVYTLSGLLAAFGGIITVSQLASSAPRARRAGRCHDRKISSRWPAT